MVALRGCAQPRNDPNRAKETTGSSSCMTPVYLSQKCFTPTQWSLRIGAPFFVQNYRSCGVSEVFNRNSQWRMGPSMNRSSQKIGRTDPHPCPMASQARHQMDAPSEEFASRSVVPSDGRGGIVGRWKAQVSQTRSGVQGANALGEFSPLSIRWEKLKAKRR